MVDQHPSQENQLSCPACRSNHVMSTGKVFSEKKPSSGSWEILYTCNTCGYHWRINELLSDEQQQALTEVQKTIEGFIKRRAITLIGGIVCTLMAAGPLLAPTWKGGSKTENIEVAGLFLFAAILFFIFTWSSSRAIRLKKKFYGDRSLLDVVVPSSVEL